MTPLTTDTIVLQTSFFLTRVCINNIANVVQSSDPLISLNRIHLTKEMNERMAYYCVCVFTVSTVLSSTWPLLWRMPFLWDWYVDHLGDRKVKVLPWSNSALTPYHSVTYYNVGCYQNFVASSLLSRKRNLQIILFWYKLLNLWFYRSSLGSFLISDVLLEVVTMTGDISWALK